MTSNHHTPLATTANVNAGVLNTALGQLDSAIPLHNLTATTDPSGSDDINSGYSRGSLWVDTTVPEIYICLDNTAAAAEWEVLRTADVVYLAGDTDDWTGGSDPGTVVDALDDLASRTPVSTTRVLNFVIDGGGSVITTGVKGFIEVPYACTISEVRLLADQSGSIVIDIWKDTYANYPPTDADSITASAPPTLSSAAKSEDSTLTGWTKSLSKGDILGFNVDSVDTITRVTLVLELEV